MPFRSYFKTIANVSLEYVAIFHDENKTKLGLYDIYVCKINRVK